MPRLISVIREERCLCPVPTTMQTESPGSLTSMVIKLIIFQAQVSDPSVPETQFNVALAHDLDRFHTIYIMGDAKPHCVANSLKQLLDFAPAMTPKLVLVTDCMSDVTGFGHLADPVCDEARSKSARFVETVDIFN